MYYYDEHVPLVERMKNQEDEIFNLIKEYFEKHNYPPTVRELARKASVSSTSSIARYLQKLKDKGLIDWQPKIPRTIIILQKDSPAK